ncbi:3'(2'),5'-bisphosphate nucleotidase CysQ [Vreelandella populi]|uniref:3'(2'),5'-bisphosphate nucleotidase CysQ n=1 Tax=Vreelandella populi TaxID=2498858 RepID=A0A433LB47_9GAMM|nr:3'(2'),5'-bisphosphate nucleotidase CysQ [Halomonas populi]RUR42405.1 3'(2'),5'-bisphosphate nucleotidase [Halomonas populi]RUR45990.1 3'(2'),5'-bisphosphate nucleotidase [Halomonas populi]RUR57966.1 3'(2'),5'-bisphosphate nucleotidase [Halomonas populi]
MDYLLAQVLDIAREAGEAILRIYAQDFEVDIKADNSPVTTADNAANQVILDGLKALPESIPILSEEGGESFAGPDAQGRYWLVDPLDGTKEFVKRNDEFTVNIALIENGKPILGVVLAPVFNVAYIAANGIGAFRVDEYGRQAIHVAGKPDKGNHWRVMGSRYHANAYLESWLKQLGPHETRLVGSSLKFGLIAEGSADVYPRLGPTSLWDTAAAQAVVEQAGGRVVTMAGTPLSYANPAKTLNPNFVAWGH